MKNWDFVFRPVRPSVRPSVRLSVRPSVIPRNSSETTRPLIISLGSLIVYTVKLCKVKSVCLSDLWVTFKWPPKFQRFLPTISLIRKIGLSFFNTIYRHTGGTFCSLQIFHNDLELRGNEGQRKFHHKTWLISFILHGIHCILLYYVQHTIAEESENSKIAKKYEHILKNKKWGDSGNWTPGRPITKRSWVSVLDH